MSNLHFEMDHYSGFRPSSLSRFVPPLIAALGSCLVAYFSLHLWNAHFGVPLQYGGDELSHTMHLEQLVQNGWFWKDSRLGAPFSQHMQDWPVGDITSLVTGWVFARFTTNWFAVSNAVYLISFPLIGLSAWWALHRFGLNRWTAAAMAILYSVVPYHFVRGENHLFLSNYYVVPLGAFLAVRLLEGATMFSWSQRWRSVQTILLCVIVGLGGIYYAAFTLLFVLTVAAIKICQRKSFISALVVGALVVCSVVIATSPAIIYHLQHGGNTDAAVRNAFESDVYGLKLAQMVAPAPGHRIESFDNYQQKYLDSFPLPGERGSASLGVVASFGLLWMFGIAIANLARGPFMGIAQEQIRRFSMLSIVGFLVATVGGFSTIIGLLVIGDIRSWNRMSIFIALFALGTVGLLVDQLASRLKTRLKSGKRVAFGGALLLIVVIGYLDQVTPTWVPAYGATDSVFFDHQKYFKQVEATMNKGDSVFILPKMDFPEASPVDKVQSNDELIPYLQTRNLKWSFGGVKGRTEAAWQSRVSEDPPAMVGDLIAAGFQGLLVDQYGYDDKASAINASLQSTLNSKPIVDPNNRYAFYDLRPYANHLKETAAKDLQTRHDQLLYPVSIVYLKNFYPQEHDATGHWSWAEGTTGTAVVENASTTTRQVRIDLKMATATSAPATISVKWSDGLQQTVNTSGGVVDISHTQAVKPGSSLTALSTTAGGLPIGIDTRDLHFKMVDADVTAG